jgi:nucleoside-diphosphate-sugar epimerase
MSEKKIVLYGSHGFLGEHLYKELSKQGWEVLRGDRLGLVPEETDYIIDVAAYGNMYSHQDIERIYTVNFSRTTLLLKNAQKQQVKGVILTSTSSVDLKVQTFYSASKMAAQYYGIAVAQQLKAPIAIVKPYTIYGYGDNPEHLIPTIFRSCLIDEPMRLDPKPVHDYIYIDDIVNAYITILNNMDKAKGKVLAVGTAVQSSNELVLREIEMMTGKRANVTKATKMREYDTDKWMADIGEVTKLGWRPKYTLTEGLYKIYEHYKPRFKETYN